MVTKTQPLGTELMRNVGTKFENKACDFLKNHGLKLITRNFNCRQGEIDLVMKDKNVLVFTEVRFRSKTNYGGSLASITRQKQQRIIRAATYYLTRHKLHGKIPCRFDVVGIDGNKINWIKQAFQVE